MELLVVLAWFLLIFVIPPLLFLYIIEGKFYRDYARLSAKRLLKGKELKMWWAWDAAKKHIMQHGSYDERRYFYEQGIELGHLLTPSLEMPPINPDWTAINELSEMKIFPFSDEGEKLSYSKRTGFRDYITLYVNKSDYNSDTLKLIELLNQDVIWFYRHNNEWYWGIFLDVFLKKKYPKLSDYSVEKIIETRYESSCD